ncbi:MULTISPECIES: HVO_A0556 family zinc finger protein [Haloferax]|nr:MULTISPECIES: HVO_A0556 family zinc finger protein [Haloferax]
MSQSAVLLNRLDEDNCSFCDGDLVVSTYKGNDAVVCDECGTPTIQLW